MTVYRTRPLPRTPSAGHLVVPEAVRDATVAALLSSGRPLARHEGLVFWAGRVVETTTLVVAMVVPDAERSPYRAIADEAAIGNCARIARQHQLGLVAQVHSHPGADTRHSDGDDDLTLMPFEGMFSLVVANYGRDGMNHSTTGVHQYLAGRWVSVTDPAESVIFIPSTLALES